MLRSQFRLATLLKLRKEERDRHRQRLAEAQQAQAILDQQRDELNQEEQELADIRRQAASPWGLDVNLLLTAGQYQLTVQSHEKMLQDQCQLLEQELQKRHATLIEANRDVEVLRRLRDRQDQEQREVEQRRESRELDEIANQNYVRKDERWVD